MAQYQRKPMIVEAEQFLISENPEKYPEGVIWDEEKGAYYVITIHNQRAYLVDRDYVVKEPDGVHYYPCKPDIFESRHDKI